MSRSIDPTIRDYLRARAVQWLKEEGHTARDLAKRAGVSPAQISGAVNEGAIGWRTMMGLANVFQLSLSDLDREAQTWAAKNPHADPPRTPPAGKKFARLRDREEWERVARATLEQHGELDQVDIDAAGRFPDDPDALQGLLDVPTVAGIAAVLRARRQRLEKQRPPPK